MAISPSFTATQSIADLSQVTFVDTSTGSDVTITERRIYFQLADGTYLVQSGTLTDYESWDYADVSKTLSLLSRSQAANITVQWLASGVVLYTSSQIYVFNLYDYIFLYNLTQIQTGQPTIVSDTNYYNNKIKMIVNLNDAENAVVLADDIYSSQGSLDRNAYMIAHQSIYF